MPSEPSRAEIETRIAAMEKRLSTLETEQKALAAELHALRQACTVLTLSAHSLAISTPAPQPPANQLLPEAKLALFRRLFRGREDVYARRWESAKTQRSGYSPACEGGWEALKQDPKDRKYLPLTDSVIRNHLRGEDPDWRGRDFVVGVYPLLTDETCWFLAADFDKTTWREDARAFLETCHSHGVTAAMERSRSGNGAHIWLFFSEPVPAGLARKLGAFLLTRTMERRPEIGLDSYDRFFPNQDTMPAGGGALTAIETLADETREHLKNSKATNTLRAYKADWVDFTEWCRQHGRTALPASPDTVALYLTHCARGLKPSTIQRRIATISEAHRAANNESPTKSTLVRSIWQGIRRERGIATEGKEPALTADLRCMVDHLPKDKLLSARDRALLLIGFAGAMRRSELVGLDFADVSDTTDGCTVTIRPSKTDQYGSGRKIGIPYGSTPLTCPVRALQSWIQETGLAQGPIFRAVDRHGKVSDRRLSDQTVARVVKRALAAAGRNAEKFAGHSLRAGLATQAAMGGASERSIQEQTGHKSLIMLRRYIRDGSLFRENAAAKTGL